MSGAVRKDTATPMLRNLAERLPRRAMLADGASRVAELWKERFRALDAQGNKSGMPHSGFWLREGEQQVVISDLTEERAVVANTSRAVAKRMKGGEIRPVSGRALSIPRDPAAAGIWPSNWPGELDFIPVLRGKLVGLLVEKAKQSGALGRVLYALVTSVRIKAMGRDVFPDRSATDAAAKAGMQAALARWVRRGGK